MGKLRRKSIMYLSIKRLDSQMAIGSSRYEAKKAARAAAQVRGEQCWSFSDYLIRSHKTRTGYQYHILRFVSWARENWGMIQFCLATGASSAELRYIRVCDVSTRPSNGKLVVRLTQNGGRTWREVEVFPGREQAVLSQIAGLEQVPEVRLFVRISGLLNIQSYRRQFAQELYTSLSRRTLPPYEGRLRPADLDHEAALEVCHRLGLRRIDAVVTHYLR